MKHANDMTDREFAAAMAGKAWRGPTLTPQQPEPKPAAALTDEELNTAIRAHAWRQPKEVK